MGERCGSTRHGVDVSGGGARLRRCRRRRAASRPQEPWPVRRLGRRLARAGDRHRRQAIPGASRPLRRRRRRASTRQALGHAPLGRRVLRARKSGWDVASLQFLLAWHGFPSGRINGRFGAATDAALRRFQRWAGIDADGQAGPATLAALRASPPRSPIPLAPPCAFAPTQGFGPRGDRFHSGLDYPLARGRPGAGGEEPAASRAPARCGAAGETSS